MENGDVAFFKIIGEYFAYDESTVSIKWNTLDLVQPVTIYK